MGTVTLTGASLSLAASDPYDKTARSAGWMRSPRSHINTDKVGHERAARTPAHC
jgi:hypothetical protein